MCVYIAMHVHVYTCTYRNIGICVYIHFTDKYDVCEQTRVHIFGAVALGVSTQNGFRWIHPTPPSSQSLFCLTLSSELSYLVQVLAPQRHLLTTLFLAIDT